MSTNAASRGFAIAWAIIFVMALAVLAVAPGIGLAHMEEESVPSAENPGAPVFGASAPAANPSPSSDWERVPAASRPPASPEPAAPAAFATYAITQKPPAADANTPPSGADAGPATAVAGAQEVNAGPPPALDLGAIQTAPDLAEVSLASEITKADTPALAAALRVTEQARVELASGNTDSALRDLGRAVSIDPGNPFGYFYLGRAYLARRNYQQALTFFKRAEIGFSSRPDWLGETIGFEGACYEELGQATDAALAYKRALESSPNNLMARVGYSRRSDDLPPPVTANGSTTDTAATGPPSEALPPPENADALPAPVEGPPPPPPDGSEKPPPVDDLSD